LGPAEGAAGVAGPVVRGPDRGARGGSREPGRTLPGAYAGEGDGRPRADLERRRVVPPLRGRSLHRRLLLRQAGRDARPQVPRVAVPAGRRRALARGHGRGVPAGRGAAAAGATRADQHLPRAVLAHRGRGGERVSRRGEAARAEGERRQQGRAQSQRRPLGPTLRQCAAVVAEDTRHTKPLLAHAGARGALVSFHAHSSAAALRRILHLLGTGKDVALVTDAGTPAVSDPGAELVAAARARDVNVVTVPGPTAVAAALSVSGLAADRYLFLGFLPRKGGERRRLLDFVAQSEWTVVLFE